MWLDSYDSNALTLSGTTVTAWADRSGQGNSLNISSGTPTYTNNATLGRSGISFNGTSFLRRTTFSTLSSENITNFVVLTLSNNTNNGFVLSFGPNSGTRIASLANPSTLNRVGFYSGSTGNTPGVNITANEPVIICSTSPNPGSTSTGIYANESTSATGINTPNALSIRQCAVGTDTMNPVNAACWSGFVFEVICYNRALTVIERQQVTGYLAWKWRSSGTASWLPAFSNIFPYFVQPMRDARPFEPPDVDNLIAWFDGLDTSTITLDSNNRVTQWLNKRTMNDGLVERNATFGPTYSNDGSLFFNNNNSATLGSSTRAFSYTTNRKIPYTNNSSNASVQGMMVFYAVYRNSRPATTTSNVLCGLGGTSPARYIDLGMGTGPTYTGPYTINGGSPVGTFSTSTAWSTSNVYSILGVSFLNGTVIVRMNGTRIGETAGSAYTPNNQFITFMNVAGVDSNVFTGYIKEMLVYDSFYEVTTRESCERIEGYLAWKWNLQSVLPSTHPFKGVPTMTPIVGTIQSIGVGGSFSSYNRYGDYRFRISAGNSIGGRPSGIAVDSFNNFYCATSTDVFRVYNRDDTIAKTFTGYLNNSALLLSYYPSGYIRWAAGVESSGNDFGWVVEADSSGNVILGASTGTSVTITNGDNTTQAVTFPAGSGGVPTTVHKFNNDGIVQWSAIVQTGGATTWSTPGGIRTDASNNIFVLGNQNTPTMVVYNSANVSQSTITRVGNASPFIVKYNTSGNVLQYTRFGATSMYAGQFGSPYNQFSVVPGILAIDASANFFSGGYFTGTTLTVYNHPGTTSGGTLTNLGTTCGCVVKYTQDLAVSALVRIGGSGNHFVYGIDTDAAGNVYVVGTFPSTVTFYNANGTIGGTLTLRVGSIEGFVAKYTNDLTYLWSFSVASSASGTTAIRRVCVDRSTNQLILSGETNGTTIVFFPQSSTVQSGVFSRRQTTGFSPFLARVEADTGKVIWCRQFSTIGGTTNLYAVSDLAVDSEGILYTVSGFDNLAQNVTKYYFNT